MEPKNDNVDETTSSMPENNNPITSNSPEQQAPSAPMMPQADTNSVVNQPKSNKKLLIIIAAAVLVLLTVGTIVTMAVLNKDDSSEADSLSLNEALAESETSGISGLDDGDESEPVAKKVESIDKKIEDTDTGFTISASEIVISPFAIPEKYSAAYGDKVVVLLKVKVTTQGKYSGAPAPSQAAILDSKGVKATTTSIMDSDMKAAGYTPAPLSGPSASSGASAEGYVLHLVDKDATDKLTMVYNRFAVNVLNGEDLPAKTFEVVIRG